MDDLLPLQKVSIPGPTLSSMIQRFSSSQGDIEGLLFGTISRFVPSNLSDEDPPSYQISSVIATVTSFLSATPSNSFHDSYGLIRPPLLQRIQDAKPPSSLIGWFSGRRRTPIRPSMREISVSSSLSKSTPNPNLFLLLVTPVSNQAVHTHEYRAYQYCPDTVSFDPKSIDIITIGPDFRGPYSAFSSNSPFPMLACEFGSLNTAMEEDEETLNDMKIMARNQKELDMCADGFQVGNLSQLMGSEAEKYTSGLEDLYEKMLRKLEGLARHVDETSDKVLEQENQNIKLRYKVASLG